MSLSHAQNIALNSMVNNQYAITVVSQNIANVNVEGYRRQRVDFETNQYTTNCFDVLTTIRGMNGASIASLTDFTNNAAFNNLINSNSDANYYNTLADSIGDLEEIANDLGDDGLNALMSNFFLASANLEQYPTDMAVRQQYVIAAQNVCDKLNDVARRTNELQQEKFDTIDNNITVINSLLSNLTETNEALAKNGKNSATQGQIEDIISQLSNYSNIKTEKTQNGMYNVYIGDTAVVQGNTLKYTLKANYDYSNPDSSVNLTLQATEKDNPVQTINANDAFSSGSMKAYLEFLNGSSKTFNNLNDIKSSLNHVANSFATEVNKIQTYDDGDIFAASIGADENGNLILEKATTPMFVTLDGSDTINASNITVNADIFKNPFLVSAARIDLNKFKDEDGNIDPNWIKAVGNSDNATQLTALQNKKICAFDGTENNCTLSQYLINSAAKTGIDAANIGNKANVYQDIADIDATDYINSVGVNLDEELADMIKYQRSYQASAKLFTVIDGLMETIIGMI